MYTFSDLWNTPPDDSSIIRYWSYEKFLDLLSRKQIYFREISKFIETDPKEGMIPYANRNILAGGFLRVQFRNEIIEAYHDYAKLNQIVKFCQHFTCINCWSLSDKENYRMWKEYAGRDNIEGAVAIKTTIGNLKDAFSSTKQEVFIGKIKYVRHEKYRNKNYDPFSFAFLKDKVTYDWEKELRLAVVNFDETNKIIQELNGINSIEDFFRINLDKNNGIEYTMVDCNLNKLIDEVILSPWVNTEMEMKIVELLKEKGLGNTVIKQSYYKQAVQR
ncbi:MAG: hypothetical protein Q4E64_02070 [Phascolarctobacterium sp.]|uniref:hypothetical protein n=1 Tax=Phascolarctobacterium sp. TaxID=2049039 RepID=UPI0026DAB7FE|nr:hypothetical protein [Phascolarctobacterium sp.]MDO4920602.1 hypothetical protein [Phascolarctobacterium sp.]